MVHLLGMVHHPGEGSPAAALVGIARTSSGKEDRVGTKTGIRNDLGISFRFSQRDQREVIVFRIMALAMSSLLFVCKCRGWVVYCFLISVGPGVCSPSLLSVS